MKKNIVAPAVGESITEVSILKWAKKHGDAVKVGDLLLEIETDKATVEIVAESVGTLQISKQAGEQIPVGEVVGYIDDELPATAGAGPTIPPPAMAPPSAIAPPSAPPSFFPPPPGAPPAMASPSAPPSFPPSYPPPPGAPTAVMAPPSFPPLPGGPTAIVSSPSVPAEPPVAPPQVLSPSVTAEPGLSASLPLSPSVRRAVAQHGVNPSSLPGSGKDGRVTKGDVLTAVNTGTGATSAGMAVPVTLPKVPATADKPGDRRVRMSMLRQKIAERLVMAQHTAAILTTFNEVDMSAVMKLRSEQKEAFKAKHGVNLSFMSFFAKASIAALKALPEVNATIDGKDTVYHDYYDIGVAVGTERGLVVPVLRNADQLSFVELEKKIGELAIKARDGKLSMADLTGGTFTISNGGTYGSLMSTPILNPPQSGILGMHKIMDRPIAVNGKVEIRPMMYTALSYDHRIIDGKGAVTWLVTLKDFLENPEKLEFSF